MDRSCQYGKDTRLMLEKMEVRLNGNLTRLWEVSGKIEKNMNNRLPGWATFALSFLMMIIGALTAGIIKQF